MRLPSLALLISFFACGQTSSGTLPAPAASAAPVTALAPAPVDDPYEIPPEKFSDGAKSFEKVRATLLSSYYADGITEDDLYRAATAGMLERVDPRLRKYNKLLSPREQADLKQDMAGEIVGIGVQIKLDPATGHCEVLGTIPGSAAEKAGLVAGDRIITVGGKLYKGKKLRDVVADIRGKSGESVTLAVLHEDKLVTMNVARERVVYDQPSSLVLPDDIGYLEIPSFTEKTADAVKGELESLKKAGVHSLVVDLRCNPGGLFEQAISTAELLVPNGGVIVSLARRGGAAEKRTAKSSPYFPGAPVVVLVDEKTGSGAELVAGALHELRGAQLVGAHTLGKWSVQMIDDLPNGYAFKYTTAIFKTASGQSYEGTGLRPDVDVAMDIADVEHAQLVRDPVKRVAMDVQLRTAKSLLVHK
jgi:carboxyl-terminal processing protease